MDDYVSQWNAVFKRYNVVFVTYSSKNTLRKRASLVLQS